MREHQGQSLGNVPRVVYDEDQQQVVQKKRMLKKTTLQYYLVEWYGVIVLYCCCCPSYRCGALFSSLALVLVCDALLAAFDTFEFGPCECVEFDGMG